jgi:hypothetical protein
MAPWPLLERARLSPERFPAKNTLISPEEHRGTAGRFAGLAARQAEKNLPLGLNTEFELTLYPAIGYLQPQITILDQPYLRRTMLCETDFNG